MAIEIERKFLVSGDYKSSATSSVRMVQGYLNSDPARSVRVRLLEERGTLTVKGPSDASGMSRFEWSKDISAAEARALIQLCENGIIDKTRHLVPFGGHAFEVDEFHGSNDGLTVAEIELSAEDETFEKPGWLGAEVTSDQKYYNSMLSRRPYSTW